MEKVYTKVYTQEKRQSIMTRFLSLVLLSFIFFKKQISLKHQKYE